MAAFSVNSHHAYLNNEIIIRCDGSISIEDIATGVEYNFTDELSIHLTAGRHILKSEDHEEIVIIEDAIKLGGSHFKNAFVFDDSPWVFIVMKDRTYYMNVESKDEGVEFNTCPDEIQSLGVYCEDTNDYFLFRTSKDYSIYNVKKGSIVKSFSNHIFSNSYYVIFKEDEDIIIYDYRNETTISRFQGQYSFGAKFYFVDEKKLYGLSYKSTEIKSIDYVGEVQDNSILCDNTLLVIQGDYYSNKDSFYKKYKLYELGDGEKNMTCTSLLFDVFIENWMGNELEQFQYVKKERDEFKENNKGLLTKGNVVPIIYGLRFIKIIYLLNNKLLLIGELVSYPDFYKLRPKFILKADLGGVLRLDKIAIITNEKDYEEDSPLSETIEPIVPEGEVLVSKSVTGNRIITQKGILYYFHDLQKGNNCNIFEKTFDRSRYINAYFTSDGKNVVLQISRTEGKLLGIDNLNSTLFEVDGFTVARNEGYNGYKPEMSFTNGRQPVWRDPITLDIISEKEMSSHVYKSPDGSYIANTMMKTVNYNRLTKSEMSKDEVDKLKSKYNWNKDTTEEEKNAIIKLRRKLADESDKYDLFGKIIDANSICFSGVEDKEEKEKKRSQITEDDIERYITKEKDFASLIIDKLGYVCYRKNEEGVEEKRILIGRSVYYLNYVSFSYDSKYLSFAAKMNIDDFRISMEGVFEIFDLEKEEIINRIEKFPNHQLWAVWMTMFSKTGDVAFYDSFANAYLVHKSNNYNEIEEASGKSLLCFSPSGRYIACSDQNYIDYTHHPNEKWGHQPSGNVFIHSTDNFKECIEQYNDLGDGIEGVAQKAGNVASVAFSQDDKRLLIVGNDGVVVVRNLKFTGNERTRGSALDSYDTFDEPIDDYGTHYGEFAGTYAQDVMGYSDDVINDAFDGDPDAYWNID